MSSRTQSEILFEKYCILIGVPFVRIPEDQTKTPDYELSIAGQTIIVEVKEITRNREERDSDLLLKKRGYGNVLGGTPGERVRKKIAASAAQIRSRAKERFPSLLVLFDSGRSWNHLDPYHIRVAMYGLEQIHIALPPIQSGEKPYATGMSYGPKWKMSRDHNTSISAIGSLFMASADEIGLHIYHNRFAAIPLDPGLLDGYGIGQSELEMAIPGTVADWKEILPTRLVGPLNFSEVS